MSQAVLEQIIRRFASQCRVNGVLCLTSNGDPALVSAFAALGWSDPYPVEPDIVPAPEPVLEAATVEAPERAVMSDPTNHVV